RDLPAHLTPRPLDLPQAGRSWRDAARQPPCERAVRVGRLPTRKRVRRDLPAVARPAARLRQPLTRNQPSSTQALEMRTHAASVKAQLFGELIGAGKSTQPRQP